MRDALVGVMRCGEDLGVLERDDCPFIVVDVQTYFVPFGGD